MRHSFRQTVGLLWVCVVAGAVGMAQGTLAGTPPISLAGFAPAHGAQGATVNITFTGKGFIAQGLSLEFAPQQGLKVSHLHLVSPTQISAQVQIDAGAPIGAHMILLTVGNHPLRSNLPFVVTARAPCETPGTPPCPDAERKTAPPAGQILPPDPMQILRLVPNQLTAGSEGAELTLEGKNFVPGTLVSFGGREGGPPDVLVVGVPRYLNSTEIRITVNVLPLALPGGRDVQLRTPKQETVTGKGMLNVLEPPPQKPAAPSPTPSSQ